MCLKCISQPRIPTWRNATNVSKRLRVNGEARQMYWNMRQHTEYFLRKAEGCTVFDSLPPQFVCPFKLILVCTGLFDTIWESFLLCRTCHKSGEVSYLASEGKYGKYGKFEAGLVSIPTQHFFLCNCVIFNSVTDIYCLIILVVC